ncbi:MAG: ATP-dependent helicase [Polyangia bacterium]
MSARARRVHPAEAASEPGPEPSGPDCHPATASSPDDDPLLSGLSEEQRAVVLAPPGPTLVLAGAGSGKTRALVHRAAYLLRAGVPADRLLLMTFTNQAARQMLARIAAISSQSREALASLWAGTFHHLALRTLRQHGHRIGLPERFVVLDRNDAADLLASCLGEVAPPPGRSWPRPALLLSLLSLAINSEAPLHSTLARHQPDWLELLPLLSSGYDRFTARKLALGLLDFDDLLLGWRLLLCDCPDVAEAQRAQFQHILVDEYQDTSRLQAALCDELAAGYRNLMAVGDEAQSIYRFRGADLRSLLTFTARWPEAQVLHLSTNYRSGPDIVRLSNRSIAQNLSSVPAAPPRPPMRAALGPPSSPSVLAVRPALVCLPDARGQAAFVAQRARELLVSNPVGERAAGGVAVLYRHHRHARELQLELVRCGIPYVVRSGQRLGEQAHVKDVLALLRIVHNPRDSLAWGRALRQVAGVGDSGRARLIAALLEMAQFGQAPRLSQKLLPLVTPSGRTALGRFAELIDELNALRDQAAAAAARGDWLGMARLPTQLIEHIVERHYSEFARRSFTDAEQRLRELLQLGHTPRDKSLLSQQALALGTAGAETVLLDFLTALVSGEEPGSEESPARLVLSSVHQAKGLEFQTVFLLWLCEGHFPSAAALGEGTGDPGAEGDPRLGEAEDAEERRLFYVACTRAREELYLCYPAAAAAHGSLRMSRFLRELDGTDPPFERWSIQIN